MLLLNLWDRPPNFCSIAGFFVDQISHSTAVYFNDQICEASLFGHLHPPFDSSSFYKRDNPLKFCAVWLLQLSLDLNNSLWQPLRLQLSLIFIYSSISINYKVVDWWWLPFVLFSNFFASREFLQLSPHFWVGERKWNKAVWLLRK